MSAAEWFCAACLTPHHSSYRALGALCLWCGQEVRYDGRTYWLHISELPLDTRGAA